MQRFSNILFVVNSDADDSAAFAKTVELARNNQARITVLGIIDATEETKRELAAGKSPLLNSIFESKTEQVQALLDAARTENLQCEMKILAGIGFIEIIREVMEHQRDLVVKSIHTTGSIVDRMLGGIDMKLLRKCPCPVWLIKSTQQQGFKEILVGLDYQPDNDLVDKLNKQLLEMSSSLALAEFSELHIIHAWSLPHESYYRSPRSGFSSSDLDAQAQEMVAEHGRQVLLERSRRGQGLRKACHTPRKRAGQGSDIRQRSGNQC